MTPVHKVIPSCFTLVWQISKSWALDRYYFSDLIKTKTLAFFSKTLPILKADDTLPKVARYEERNIEYNPTIFHSRPDAKISAYRNRRSADDAADEDDATAATAHSSGIRSD